MRSLLDSLGVLIVDSAFVALTIVFGVVVELESDSFSKLPTSSLSYDKNFTILNVFCITVLI